MAIAKLSIEDSKERKTSFLDLSFLLKAGADSLRLEILRSLRHDSYAVSELAFIFDMVQPGMSHHLKVLLNAELVSTRRQGSTIFYRRSLVKDEDPLRQMKKSLFTTVDNHDFSSPTSKRIRKVHSERAKQSQDFFSKHAAVFVESQGKLCDSSEYLGSLKELLNLIKLPYESKVMEVGPGHGLFLEELAGRYKSLVALDSSEEMLALARQRLGPSTDCLNIDYIVGNIEEYQPASVNFNAVVLNMVMHHLSSPALVFRQMSRIVAPGGYLMIADLCSHQQAWVKESCGDLWLGFEPDEISQWSHDYDFKEVQSVYLGLKNGFQIQLRLFQRV